jgi:hypothetical protein
MKFKKIFMFLVLFFGLQTFSQDSQPAVKTCEPDLDSLSDSDWDDIVAGHTPKDIPCKKQTVKKIDLRQEHVMQEIISIIKADWQKINPLGYDGNLDYSDLIISAYEKAGYRGELNLNQTEKLIQQVLLDLNDQISSGELKFDLNKSENFQFIRDRLKQTWKDFFYDEQLKQKDDYFTQLILDSWQKNFSDEAVLSLNQIDQLIQSILIEINDKSMTDYLGSQDQIRFTDIDVLYDPDFD